MQTNVPIANAPASMKGVANLRGTIVPIIDMHLRCDRARGRADTTSPEFSGAPETRYIVGLGTVDDRMLILVDIQKLISGADLAPMQNGAH